MRKPISFLFAFAVGLLFFPSAYGGISIVIEPYLGYSQLTFREPGNFGIAESEVTTAAILGGKGGIKLSENLIGGFDYHTGGVYFLKQYREEFTQRLFGAGLTYKTQKVRLWVGYYPLSELEDSNLFIKHKGNSIKISVGFEFASKLSINLEMLMNTLQYREETVLGNSTASSAQAQIFFLSFSAPLVFAL